jgi:hypothetical protein
MTRFSSKINFIFIRLLIKNSCIFAVRNFRQKVQVFLEVNKNKKKSFFFIVRLEIVCMFAAAKKYSEKVQRGFGMILKKVS